MDTFWSKSGRQAYLIQELVAKTTKSVGEVESGRCVTWMEVFEFERDYSVVRS